MRVRLVALVPVLGLVLAGCASSAQQPPVEPPPFSATPTPTPSVVALEVPPSARATDAVGAAQFARFYLEVLEQAYQTGEDQQLKSLSDPRCQTCLRFIQAVANNKAEGASATGGAYTILSAEASENAPGDAIVDVLYDRTASVRKDPSGKVLGQAPAERRALVQLRVVRADVWRVLGVRFPETPS